MEFRKHCAENIEIFPDIFEYFALSMERCSFTIRNIVDTTEHPLHTRLQEQLSAIDLRVSRLALDDTKFYRYHRDKTPDLLAEESLFWALENALNWEIPFRRLEKLERCHEEIVPSPLEHPALKGLQHTNEHLVSLQDFKWDGIRLIRNDHAFLPFSPVESPNSQYWFLQELIKLGAAAEPFVRLDPFLHGPTNEFPVMGYKMLVYGQPFNWGRIKDLQEEEHGQWLPGVLSHGVKTTDYAWTPRGDEVHFCCEEIPDEGHIHTRGSRYFHAIYSRSRDEVIHLDGAIRVYDISEWRKRVSFQHVRRSGKIGRRYKMFRVDSPLSVDKFCSLCTHFFVWNKDVQRYFGADIPEDF